MDRVKKFDESDQHCNQRSNERSGSHSFSKNHYRAMIYEHLNNQNTYRKRDKNLDSTIVKKLKQLLNKYKNIFTDKELKYLNEAYYNRNNIYGLHKIHKS